jgi:hypothetical protein
MEHLEQKAVLTGRLFRGGVRQLFHPARRYPGRNDVAPAPGCGQQFGQMRV